jgi:DNA-binding transcriptional regulator GbsR (MarR family)
MQSTYLVEIQAEFEKKKFIEDISILFEEAGHPRMAGKILGSLLICDPPYQSARELINSTGGSKASISSMTRLLAQSGLIERTGIPGQKGIYYKLRDDSFAELLRSKLTIITSFKEIFERGLSLVPDSDKARYARLNELKDFYAFVERKFPALFEMWHKEHEKLNHNKVKSPRK